MDYKFITMNVALFGFFGIIFLAFTHKRAEEAASQHEQHHIEVSSANQNLTVEKVMVVSRIHRGEATNMVDMSKVIKFIEGTLPYSTKTIVCVDIGQSLENMEYFNSLRQQIQLRADLSDHAKLLPITPWGKFTQALNAAVQLGLEHGMENIIFQSLEVSMDPIYAKQLIHIVNRDPTMLVAGPELNGHEFKAGKRVLNGRTCPWNTFAVWRLKHLALSGFPLVSDGMGSNFGGVEEIATVAVLQKLHPELRAMLVRNTSSPANWDTNFGGDPAREAWHQRKMASKVERAAKQLELLNLAASPGVVEHVII